jgi:hypothetical protein
MPPVADEIKGTQNSFQDQKPGAVASCPFAGLLPQESAPLAEQPEPVEMKIFPGETETNVATPAPVKDKKEEQKKAWIEIILVDMDGNPMPGVKYRITPPGGEPKEDFLNEHGQGGYYEIEPGSCKVTFPELDKDAWE